MYNIGMKKIIIVSGIVLVISYFVFHQISGNKASVTPVTTSSGTYKDGTYTGSSEDAFYGNLQVQATISGGKITDVQFLQYPNDRSESQEINSHAIPTLTSEAIQSQNAHVDIVSGATDSSQAFQKSLQSALNQAQG